MKSALSFVAVALLVAGSANASVLEGRTVERIFKRQVAGFDPSQIPQQCQATCAGTSSVLTGQGCQTDACLCTASVNTGFQQCLNCVIALAPSAALTAQGQAALAQYEDACKNVGFPLASLTLSGGSVATGGGGSVTLPTGSNTGTVFFSTPTGSPTGPAGGPNSPTRTVIGPSDTNSPSPTADNSGSGQASSGEQVFVNAAAVAGAAVVGAAALLL